MFVFCGEKEAKFAHVNNPVQHYRSGCSAILS